MKFKVGDRVKVIGNYRNGETGEVKKVGDRNIEVWLDSCLVIHLKSSPMSWRNGFEEEDLKLIKEAKMDIRKRIENINEDTTIKELDDLREEVRGSYKVRLLEDNGGYGWFQIFDEDENIISTNNYIVEFHFSDQCSKLKALIKSLLWLDGKTGKLEEEKTYEIGDRFKNEGDYILAQVSPRRVVMVNLQSGNRWAEEIIVEDVRKITQEEFNKIANAKAERFTPLKEEYV